MKLRVQILPGLKAKRYKSLKRIIANAVDFTGRRFYLWVIDYKYGTLLATTEDLANIGEPFIIVTDVGRGPGSVSDIFFINY